MFDNTFTFSASIKFKNMNTEGEQKIEASDFPGLYKKVQQFIEQLN